MSEVIWHDLECGGYEEDLPLWRELAAARPGPVLEVGAGTGRVSLELARQGYEVIALEREPELRDELARRGSGLPVRALAGDARHFASPAPVSLCLVPMQTVQLLGGPAGRAAFLACARRALRDGGLLAAAIVPELRPFTVGPGVPAPLPDVRELDGTLFWSQPVAVRAESDHYVLERRREVVAADGTRQVTGDQVALDRVTVEQLEAEGREAGLRPSGRRRIGPSGDYVGSEVVLLGG